MNRRRHQFAIGMTVLILLLIGIASVNGAQPKSTQANWESLEQLAQGPPQRASREIPAQREVAQESPRPLLTTDQAKQKQPAPPLSWVEVALMLAGGRPNEDAVTVVKERGIAFDVDPDTLWFLEALGASDALLQAVRAARVYENYVLQPATLTKVGAEAEPVLRQALKARPSNAALQYALARSLHYQEKWDAAIAEYRETLRLKPDFATAHGRLGLALALKGDLQGAEAESREAVRLGPNNADAHHILGFALSKKRDMNGAIAEFREAVRLKPEWADTHAYLGLAFKQKGDLEGAIAEYREAVRLKPEWADTHAHLGLALGQKGDLEGEIAELREAVRLKPEWEEGHAVLGDALAQKGDLEGAIAEYREAARLKPERAEAHADLGYALQKKGDLEGAEAEYREALRLRPGDPQFQHDLVVVLGMQGKSAAAEKESRQAVRRNPNDPLARNCLGAALLAKGDVKGAIKELREAVRLKPDLAESHDSLGMALRQKGDLEGAVAELREALRLKPDWADTHFILGQTLERKGNKAGALEAFRQAYTLAPQNPDYKAKYEELSPPLSTMQQAGQQSSQPAGQNVKVKVRAALHDRDLNTKPIPHLVIKLVPASSGGQPITIQTNLDGVAEATLPSGKYHVATDAPIEQFEKAYRWELDADFSRPDNALDLSNDNAKATPLAAARDAHVGELAYHFERVKDAVVTVWTEYGSFDGFIVDPAGLVLTVRGPLDRATWLVVQLDDRHRLPAVLAASDVHHDVAVIRINPSTQGQITSVQLSTDPGALVEGDGVFAIENPGSGKGKKLVTGVVSKADLGEIVSDVRFSPGAAGGPLFDSSGSAVGLIQQSGGEFRIQPIAVATEALTKAKQKLASSPPPPSGLLPSIPTDQFPVESLSALGQSRWEKDVYSFDLGKFHIEFVTPVASYETDREQYEKEMGECRRSKSGASPPVEPDHKYAAVLVIFAIPKTKAPIWDNVVNYWNTHDRYGPPTPRILHYETAFLKMQLVCGDRKVDPYWPGRVVVGGESGSDRWSSYVVADEAHMGRYVYANDAISPQCGKVTLQVFSTKDPEHPLERVLDEKVVTRLWQDFEPFRNKRGIK